jgi:predicted nucleic acid-binding protein
MIFVDSNIPMYLIGNDAVQRTRAQALLEHVILAGERLVTSAEVLQEILHRYVAIKHRDAIQPAFDVLLGVVDEVFAIDLELTQRARQILLERPRLSARDALHLATMERHGIERILTFDAGFDGLPGIRRVQE